MINIIRGNRPLSFKPHHNPLYSCKMPTRLTGHIMGTIRARRNQSQPTKLCLYAPCNFKPQNGDRILMYIKSRDMTTIMYNPSYTLAITHTLENNLKRALDYTLKSTYPPIKYDIHIIED